MNRSCEISSSFLIETLTSAHRGTLQVEKQKLRRDFRFNRANDLLPQAAMTGEF